MTLKDIIKTAKIKDLDGIALLDHNTLDGYFESQRLDTDLIIVPGMEISTHSGHIIALGIEEEIEPRLSVAATIRKIREKGGISIASHPRRFWSGLGEKQIRTNDWDAIEGLNGRSLKWNNRRAQKMAEELDLPVTGGSDAHRLKRIGEAFTILENVENWEDVIQEVKKGNTDVGGKGRKLSQNLFYVKRTFSRWVRRGFRRI